MTSRLVAPLAVLLLAAPAAHAEQPLPSRVDAATWTTGGAVSAIVPLGG